MLSDIHHSQHDPKRTALSLQQSLFRLVPKDPPPFEIKAEDIVPVRTDRGLPVLYGCCL
jgi:hypothetical protein